jgi:hypothetical protein
MLVLPIISLQELSNEAERFYCLADRLMAFPVAQIFLEILGQQPQSHIVRLFWRMQSLPVGASGP